MSSPVKFEERLETISPCVHGDDVPEPARCHLFLQHSELRLEPNELTYHKNAAALFGGLNHLCARREIRSEGLLHKYVLPARKCSQNGMTVRFLGGHYIDSFDVGIIAQIFQAGSYFGNSKLLCDHLRPVGGDVVNRGHLGIGYGTECLQVTLAE